MADYLGETYVLHDAPDGFGGVKITPDDGVTMAIKVWDPELTLIVDDEPMEWDEAVQRWQFLFNTKTRGLTLSGTYRWKPVVVGAADSSENFEYERLRLKARPAFDA